MAERFNLPCPNCKFPNPVDSRQAGESISCPKCRQNIEIPTLRGLRQLNPAEPNEGRKEAQIGTGQYPVSRATFALGLVLALVGLGAGGGLWYAASQLETEPAADAVEKLHAANFAAIDKSNLNEFWTIWHEEIIARPPGAFRLSRYAANRQVARTRKTIGLWFFGLVPLGAAAMIGSAFIRK